MGFPCFSLTLHPYLNKAMKDLPGFHEISERRRSVRHYREEPLQADEVLQLMRPALRIPSSKGRRAYEYVMVDDADMLQALSQCKAAGGAFLRKAPLGIVVCGRMDLSDVWIEDAAVAATTMLYAAESLGLGACWIQVRERYLSEDQPAASIVKGLLHLPDYVEPVAIIAVGHPSEPARPRTGDLPWEKVHINGWETDEDGNDTTDGGKTQAHE